MSLTATSRFTPGDTRGLLDRIVSGFIAPAVANAAKTVSDQAQGYAPVRSGDLRESIRPTEPVDDGKRVTACVVATSDHAGYVEFGTGIRGAATGGDPDISYSPEWAGMEAQPYLRTALDSSRPQVIEEFQ